MGFKKIGLFLLFTALVSISIFFVFPKKNSLQKMQDQIPTTHTWYSSLLDSPVSEKALAAFSLPNSYRITDREIEIGLPRITFAEKTVHGPHIKDLSLRFANSQKLTSKESISSGEWNVGFDIHDENGKTIAVNLTKGSPLFSFSSLEKVVLEGGIIEITKLSEQIALIKTRSNHYLAHGKFTITSTPKTLEFINPNSTNSIVALPKDILGENIQKIADCSKPFTQTSYSIHSNKDPIEVEYLSSDKKNHLFTVLPHMGIDNKTYETLGVYQTVRGELALICTNKLTFRLLGSDLRGDFRTFVNQSRFDDVAKDYFYTDYETIMKAPEPAGVYFKGKYLKNLIDLWEVAGYLEKEIERRELHQKIKTLLLTELSSFRYEEHSGLVFHSVPEFGHESGNDHHYQYGYYIASYARFYNEFSSMEQKGVEKVITNFIKEGIPGYFKDSKYPLTFRFLDSYEGHSWADAKAQFADGNNEESSSEALYYWYAFWLWGEKTHDKKLTDLSEFAFSLEVAGTQTYNFLANNKYLESNFKKPLISLVWGGKGDYATWFSADEDKILGIEILPLNPSSFVSLKSNRAQKLMEYYDTYFSENGKRDFYNYYVFYSIVNGGKIPGTLYRSPEFIPLSLLYLLQRN